MEINNIKNDMSTLKNDVTFFRQAVEQVKEHLVVVIAENNKMKKTIEELQLQNEDKSKNGKSEHSPLDKKEPSYCDVPPSSKTPFKEPTTEIYDGNKEDESEHVPLSKLAEIVAPKQKKEQEREGREEQKKNKTPNSMIRKIKMKARKTSFKVEKSTKSTRNLPKV